MEDIAGWQDKRPVIDKTGLKEGSIQTVMDARGSCDGRKLVAGSESPLADALASELGLKVENGIAPWPGLPVDNADEEPAPDPPDTAKIYLPSICRSLTFLSSSRTSQAPRCASEALETTETSM